MSKKKPVIKKKPSPKAKKAVSVANANVVTAGGINYRSDKNKYIARFTHNGKRITVGSFATEGKAKHALNLARRTAMSA